MAEKIRNSSGAELTKINDIQYASSFDIKVVGNRFTVSLGPVSESPSPTEFFSVGVITLDRHLRLIPNRKASEALQILGEYIDEFLEENGKISKSQWFTESEWQTVPDWPS